MALREQDRKDLEKFTKFLINKSMQIIVQSRLGDKIATKSKAQSSGADWFNLNIQDISDVSKNTKQVLAGQVLNYGQSVCLEISLKTVEGDSLVLETWYLNMSSQSDPRAKIAYSVYNHMGSLLKSLFSVTHMLPAYKLSRKQGAESYVICYRIYLGEPVLNTLGSDLVTNRIGAVVTPLGTISLNVAYRTKLTISPQSSQNLCIEDDYFESEIIPKPCHEGYDKSSKGPVNVPYNISSTASPPNHVYVPQGSPHTASKPNRLCIGAFAPNTNKDIEDDLDDIPFMSLLQPVEMSVTEENEEINKEVLQTDHRIVPQPATDEKTDFVMVELKMPFAEPEASTDLGKFYKDCQTAPDLNMFEDKPNLEETLNNVTEELNRLESCVPDFDHFVNSLTISD